MEFKNLSEISHIRNENIINNTNSSLIYVTTSNILPNKKGIDLNLEMSLDKSGKKFYKNDILVSNIRPYFKKIWKANMDGITSNDVLIFYPNEEVNLDYLYFVLAQDDFFDYATKTSKGTKMPRGDKAAINKFKILLPKLNIQKKIASILSNLDSKIEINNKIISNLESQAQAIFKSWFVDFEPFQDGDFVESELGMIPEGWEVKPIGELIDFDIGGGWGKEKPQEKYLIPAYVIRGTDIPNSKLGYFNMDNYRYHTESNLKNRRLQVGDIIFESSGGSTNQDLGRMLLVTDELLNEYNNDIICASFCKLIRINDSSIRWFVYNLLEYSYRNKILTKYEVKSTGISNFSFTIFKDDFKIAVPNRKTMERYFNVTGNNINLSAKLGIQNTKLAELRDALLPKLMAGEIDVSNIKIEGEEVKNE